MRGGQLWLGGLVGRALTLTQAVGVVARDRDPYPRDERNLFCGSALLIWRFGRGGAAFSDHCVVVGVAGALAGRHERKVQCARRRSQTDIRGLYLKTRCSSRLAV